MLNALSFFFPTHYFPSSASPPLQHVRRLPLPEQRQAELALYRRRPEQAESILLAAQPPLVWRAIEMNLRCRALSV